MNYSIFKKISLLISLLISLVGKAYVQNDIRCAEYAKRAVEQYEEGKANYCEGIVGPRWSDDYNGHYRWCVTAPPAQADQEQKAREELLAKCKSEPGVTDACDQYAKTAVAQNEENLRRGCGFTGPQWSSDYEAHYNWCANDGNLQLAEGENQFRQRALLEQCATENEESSFQENRYISKSANDPFTPIIIPVYMYYLERYFSDLPDKTETDLAIASILDESAVTKKTLFQTLTNYRNLSPEKKQTLFDKQMLWITAQRDQPLDKELISERINNMIPELGQKRPAPPTALKAENKSRLPNPDFSGSEKYQIQLSWQDNSLNEDGFLIYRTFKQKGVVSLPGTGTKTKLVATVGPNVHSYLDNLSLPTDPMNQYCYQVKAFKVNKLGYSGQNTTQLVSDPTQTACSYYSPILLPPPPDTDKDGYPDDYDACKTEAGVFPHGCPDADRDGVIDFYDQCPNEPGDPQIGPFPPKLGCPVKYNLRWMGMKILNNSLDHRHSPSLFYYNESNALDFDAGEEPYLLFSFLHGHDQGVPRTYTSKWCCGERVDVKKGQNFEPDNDPGFEEFPSNLPNIQKYGLKVFPGHPKDTFAPIDPLGLLMTMTLMEKDDKIIIEASKQAELGSNLLKLGKEVIGSVSSCVGTAGLGCIKAIGMAFKSLVDTVFGALATKPPPVEVDDPDDYMGTVTWTIDRNAAEIKTRQNGAFAFHWDKMPTSYWTVCPYQPCGLGGKVATMLVQPYFCLYREGIPDSQIKKLCAPSNMVMTGQ